MKSFNIGDLKIPVPIVQGGMGIGISLSGLASAVANMGGIGVISSVGIGFIERNHKLSLNNSHIEAMRQEIRKARGNTYTGTVQGYRNAENNLWDVNQLATIDDDFADISRSV